MPKLSRPLLAAATLAVALLQPVAATGQRPIPLDTLRAAAGSRVLAGAAAATRSVQVIDRAGIAALPVRSVNDVLARALGVDLLARSPAQADLAIRGSGFEQVLVMVDGVPVNDDQTGHFHLNIAVPLDAVERIEVVRGPASSLYGSGAVGGVVNIVTRKAAPRTGMTARLQGGSFGSAAGGIDARTVLGSARVDVAAGYDRSDGHRPGTDHAVLQARAAAEVLVAGGTLRVRTGWAARDFGAEGFYAPFDSYEETRTATASASWRSAPAAFTLEPRVSLRRHDDDFILVRDNPALYRNIHTSTQTAAELVARWQPTGGAVGVAAGTEGVLSSLESTNLGDREENRIALFAELAAGDAARFLTTAGLRLDRHSTFGSHLSPSVAAGWQASAGLRLRASAAGGFRAPSWTDRYYRDPANIGDPDLDAEKFWTAEVGGQATLAPAVHLDATAFVRRATDLIDWGRPAGAPPSEPWRTMNVESATFAGVETSLTAGIGAALLTLGAAVIDVDASTTAGMVSKYALRPLSRTVAAELAVPLGLGFAGSVRGAAYARTDGDEWQLIDVRLRRDFGRLSAFVDATNLANTRYQDVSDRPAPGRAWSLGARVR